jgi:hypothetical protein
MADPKLKAELEALRAQVAYMTKRFDEQSGTHEPAEPAEPESASSPLDEVRRIAEQLHAPELFDLATKYLSDIGQDIQASKPRALIAAFLAGFIAGKAVGR